jgi:hypothetical protein
MKSWIFVGKKCAFSLLTSSRLTRSPLRQGKGSAFQFRPPNWAEQRTSSSSPSPSDGDWILSETESQLLYNWRFTANQFLAPSPLRLTTINFILQLNACGYSPFVTSSLTRGWVCRLQLLLVLASVVILRSESRGTRDILGSQIRDSHNLEGQVPAFMSPRNRVARLYPPGTECPFPRLLLHAGLRWRYSSCVDTGFLPPPPLNIDCYDYLPSTLGGPKRERLA